VVGVFSLETKARRIADRILAEQVGIPSNRVRRGMISEADFKTLAEASQLVAELPLFVDDSPALTTADVVDRATALSRENNLGLLIIDYLQLIGGGERQGEGRYQEIAEITAGLKSLAMSLNIPIIAISRLSRSPESREDKRPTLTDLVGSGSIENDADVVLLIFREEYYLERGKPGERTIEFQDWMARMQLVSGRADILVVKNRHGPIGTFRLQFDPSIGRFSDIAKEAPSKSA
jgi:replicative DNA helicase